MYLNTDVKDLRPTLGAKLTNICFYLTQDYFNLKETQHELQACCNS